MSPHSQSSHIGPIGAAILVGGSARRLGGRAKGLIKIGGESLIERLVAALPMGTENIFLVGNPDGPYGSLGYEIHPDIIPMRGAPGGVYTALHVSPYPWLYVLACDQPLLDRSALQKVRPHAGYHAVLPRVGKRVHFLSGLWSKTAMQTIGEHLTTGHPSLGQIVATLRVDFYDAPKSQAYFNLNTAPDLRALRAIDDASGDPHLQEQDKLNATHRNTMSSARNPFISPYEDEA